MFTGIVETAGKLVELNKGRMILEIPWKIEELHIGQSISCDGCCLTIISIEEGKIGFDLSPETLDRTAFGKKGVGDLVNLERSMKINGALDGHMVTGHIDTKGSVRSIKVMEDDVSWEVWIDVPDRFGHWLIEKGSASVDGVSLTVCEIDQKGFSIALIPHTIKITSMHTWKAGTLVNVEFDLIAKYVEKILRSGANWSKGNVA